MGQTTSPDTREEAASKLPALHVLMAMGWEYLSPADALALRGSERGVLLEPILRERLRGIGSISRVRPIRFLLVALIRWCARSAPRA